MDDLISREALKKAFEDCIGDCACCIHNTNDFEYCGLIDNAPTVEPICPYLSDNEVKQPCLNSPCERPQGDCISRSDLKDKMKKAEEQADTFEMLVEFYEQIIDNAPTVEPERPQGEWVYNGFTYSCSICGKSPKTLGSCGSADFMTDNFKYCPNCGADMRGSNNG